jgi:aldehyde:ferredoxin oxidoreductase
LLTKEDTGGVDLSFGNQEAIIDMIERIAYRKGIGNLLAEGTKRASLEIQGSEKYAMQVKGMDIPGHSPRILPAMALIYGVSTRGAHHLDSHGGTEYAEITGHHLGMRVAERRRSPGLQVSEKAKLAVDLQNYSILMDSLILCRFITYYAYNVSINQDCSEMLKLATGRDFSVKSLTAIAERSYILEKAFNTKAGLSRSDDTLPERFFAEPIPEGANKGKLVNRKQFASMVDEYYRIRGLGPSGEPLDKTVTHLGLDGVLTKDLR